MYEHQQVPSGQAAPAQPARPAPWRRLAAGSVDFGVVAAIAVAIAIVTYNRISAMITDVPALAETSIWRLLKSHGDVAGTATSVAEKLWHDAVNAVQQGFIALVILAFLYHFAALAFTGRTLGKGVMGLRVAPMAQSASGSGSGNRLGLGVRRPAIRAAATTVADIGCFSVACYLLVEGEFFLSVVAWLVAVGVFWLNALPALRGSGQSRADRLARTTVIDSRLLAATAGAARSLAARYNPRRNRGDRDR